MTLSKYDWGAACRFFPGFKDTPGVVRLAWEICERFNEEIGCAWPTRETLSQALGAPPESVSRWIKALSDSGAMTCISLHQLPSSSRLRIGRSSKRAQVYLINFGWALDVLGLRDERVLEREMDDNQKVTALPPLEPKGGDTATPKGNSAATSKGGSTDTLIPYTQTLDHTLEEKGAQDVSELGVSAREASSANAYARAKGRAA